MATPLGLTLSKVMDEEGNKANGFTLTNCMSELIDNSFDAGSLTASFATIQLPDGTAVMLSFDCGHGVADPLDLYSVGKSVNKKQEGCRGLKNRGHRGTAGALTGRDDIQYITKRMGKEEASTLRVNYKGLYTALEKAKNSPSRDINMVDAREFFISSYCEGLTKKTADFLRALHDNTTYAVVKDFLKGVLDNSLDHFFMMAVRYSRMPDGYEDEMTVAMQSFCRTYTKALKSGLQIAYYPSGEEEAMILGAEDAIPFLGKNPVEIGGVIRFHVPKTSFSAEGTLTDSDNIKLSFTVGGRTMWLHNMKWASFDCRFTEGASTELPVDIDDWVVITEMTWRAAVITGEEEEQQKIDKVEKARGVSVIFVDRTLGNPIHNDKWGARRDMGGIRFELTCLSQVGAELFLHIQSQKNTMSFDILHPAMKAFLNLVVGRTIIKKWSNDSDNGRKRTEGVSEWNIDEFCRMLENPKAKREEDLIPTEVQTEEEDNKKTVAQLMGGAQGSDGQVSEEQGSDGQVSEEQESDGPVAQVVDDQGPVAQVVDDQGPVAQVVDDQGPVAQVVDDQGPVAQVVDDQDSKGQGPTSFKPQHSTKIEVQHHYRITPKSERDVLELFSEASTLYMSYEPELVVNACTTNESIMTEMYKALLGVHSMIKKRVESLP